jgi:hypothetical protein
MRSLNKSLKRLAANRSLTAAFAANGRIHSSTNRGANVIGRVDCMPVQRLDRNAYACERCSQLTPKHHNPDTGSSATAAFDRPTTANEP